MVPPAKQRFNTSIMLMICDMINNFLGVIQMSKIGEAICYTIISIDYIIILKWTTLVQKRLASLI
ncbi:MAG TPA: hypothetical protein DIT95_02750 [Arenibacter sp.]|jgi:hypothetical protein|nr:hypothetical protein [Arenibacter sp.]